MSRWWVAITLTCLAIAAVGTDVSRFEAPQGDRYVNYMKQWPSDFRAGLEATRAWMAGLDPYLQALPDAVASDHFVVGDTTYRFCYPPTHLLLYVPVAMMTRSNDVAAHAWFHVMLLALLLLAVVTWLLANAITPTPPMAIPVALTLIAIQPGTLLALERVQSDIVIALLCWVAVALMQRRHVAAAVFIGVTAALIKPYPLLLAAGLVAHGVDRGRWRATALATAAALALLFAPVARYLPESLRAVRPRSEMFWASWQNWSLTDVSYAIAPRFMATGRILLSGVCVAAAALSWLHLRRAVRAADTSGQALWLTLFAVCALEAVIGASKTTFNYAMVMLLPGLAVAALGQTYVYDLVGLAARARIAACAWLTLLLSVFWLGRPWWTIPQIPLSGFAIIALVATIAAVGIARLKPSATPRAA